MIGFAALLKTIVCKSIVHWKKASRVCHVVWKEKFLYDHQCQFAFGDWLVVAETTFTRAFAFRCQKDTICCMQMSRRGFKLPRCVKETWMNLFHLEKRNVWRTFVDIDATRQGVACMGMHTTCCLRRLLRSKYVLRIRFWVFMQLAIDLCESIIY